jgi:hypothetical protein
MNRPGPRKPAVRKRLVQKGAAPAAAKPVKPAKPEPAGKEPFRVLLVVNRPRYRVRAERAVDVPGWQNRSLTAKEDPIGLLNQKLPDIVLIHVDVERNKNVGNLRAAQRFRAAGLSVIALFDTAEELEANAAQYDAGFAPPWKAGHVRAAALDIFQAKRGYRPDVPALLKEDEVGAEDTDEDADE